MPDEELTPPQLDEAMNTGFIEQAPTPSDFIAGGETGITEDIRRENSKWTIFISAHEAQTSLYFDSMACVTFSALNSIEAQINWLITSGLLSNATIDRLSQLGFLDANRRFEASDRFTAKMSGTTRAGNNLTTVWDSIRRHGLVPESKWSYPRTQRTPVFDWEDYYKEIPEEIKAIGREFLKLFETRYEWIFTPAQPWNLAVAKQKMQLAPLQIATAVCSPWNQDGIIQKCSKAVAHATMIHDADDLQTGIVDHYQPFLKKLAPDYQIPWALRGVVYPLEQNLDPVIVTPPTIPVNPPTFTFTFNNTLRFGQRLSEISKLQYALQLDGVFPKTVITTGYFGTITKNALLTYMRKHSVAPESEIAANGGMSLGPKTRASLNAQFSANK